MIDQDKMRALARGLRAAGPLACREAADAINLLLAELEAAAADKRDGHRYRELRELLLAGDIPMSE
ncbi:hypothetical protein [Burkholderia vietnamiensis]|uniref:hypothetical protein n=1 Tax=Burkholderia vietnamiensis TaxID=60552 RepID=UPI00352EA5EB